MIGISRYRIKSNKLTEIENDIKNPFRGWYQIHYFDISQQTDFEELKWCIAKEDSLAFLFLQIKSYRNRDFDEFALENIRNIIEFFVAADKELIIRAAYNNGEEENVEPDNLNQVMGHLKTLRELLEEYSDYILVYQGCLLGKWGEMHHSDLLNSFTLKELHEVMETSKYPVALRQPLYWRIIYGEEEIANNKYGFFDDAILGERYHMGTFGIKKRNKADWTEAWIAEDEMEFAEKSTDKVPFGGEALFVENMEDGERISELKDLQVTYLNRIHDVRLISHWKKTNYRNVSLYDYIGARLGYRFIIDKCSLRIKKKNIIINISIKNTGFAKLCRKAGIYLRINNTDYCICETISEIEPGEYADYEAAVPLEKLKKGDYEIYLYIVCSGKYIKFAMESSETTNVKEDIHDKIKRKENKEFLKIGNILVKS